MGEILAGVSIETMTAYTARQKVPVKMRNKSCVECAAQNNTVLVTGSKAATFPQFWGEEQHLLEMKLNTYSARVVTNYVLNLATCLHEYGPEFFASLVQNELICGCGGENVISVGIESSV